MQGGKDIRPFIVHRVTESQHFHSLDRWVKFFLPIFNNLPYSLHWQWDKNLKILFKQKCISLLTVNYYTQIRKTLHLRECKIKNESNLKFLMSN